MLPLFSVVLFDFLVNLSNVSAPIPIAVITKTALTNDSEGLNYSCE
jgi:hypothetical protein